MKHNFMPEITDSGNTRKNLFIKILAVVPTAKIRGLLNLTSRNVRINHKAILDKTIAPLFIKQGLSRCLKCGVSPDFPEQGTRRPRVTKGNQG
jgi:hypothetical protein